MRNPPSENKPLSPTPESARAKHAAGKRSTGKLPPPSSGKELSEYLDKVAATLTPEDLQDLDRAIKASRESSR